LHCQSYYESCRCRKAAAPDGQADAYVRNAAKAIDDTFQKLRENNIHDSSDQDIKAATAVERLAESYVQIKRSCTKLD